MEIFGQNSGDALVLRCNPPMLRSADISAARLPVKTADAIFSSGDYGVWRAGVVARADGRCQWPGCGIKASRMFADHIVERKDGGAPFDPANGQCLCGRHHTIKTIRERAKRLGPSL